MTDFSVFDGHCDTLYPLIYKGAKDVLNISKKPVIASHSCSYKINNNNRNMNDRIFKMLIKNKGVLGINFYPYFLTGNKNAKIKDIVSHIDHFMEIGGEKNIGLGSDFDGINVLPHNIKGNEDIYLILNELLKNNYSENIVKNIAYNNFYNAFIEIMR